MVESTSSHKSWFLRTFSLWKWLALLIWFLIIISAYSNSKADCALPDLPSCDCYLGLRPWPITATMGDIIETARTTVWTRTSCFQDGGQPYWQIQCQVVIPEAAEAIANLDADYQTDNPPAPWCTETIAFWAERASVPYAWGFYTERHHPSSYVYTISEIRLWYQTEEAIGGLARGRWIDGNELDYAGFIPGVNGPCPGAYQQIDPFDRTDPDADGTVWTPGNGHSQLVDSLIIYRLNDPTGPIQRIDVRMAEGNVGVGGGSIFARILNTRKYNDIIQFTTLGHDTALLDSKNRKIRGWGINLRSDGSVDCDSSRIRDVITFMPSVYSPPGGPENSDSSLVAQLVAYYATTGGNAVVTTNSNAVQTGGALPGPTTPWVIPPSPHPIDPVDIDIDLKANHPFPVRGITIDWLEAIPVQFEVQWAGENLQIYQKTVTLSTGAPTLPSGTVLPYTVAFAPDSGFTVRYVRLRFPLWTLSQTFQIQRFHYNFFIGVPEDSSGSSPEEHLPTAVTKPSGSLPALWLRTGYPNPFQSSVSVAFVLPDAGPVRLAIYDVLGRRMRVLMQRFMPAGSHEAVWDGSDERNRACSSGIYFVHLKWRQDVRTTKLVLMR